MRLFIILMCIPVLAGCTGSAYQLPTVDDAALQAMQEEMYANRVPLKMYHRSDSKYEKMLAAIHNRLVENAQPLCDHAGYISCLFQISYSGGNEMNAYASEDYKITVYRGLLQYLESDDEIAAVVAHEMGHHLAHHNKEKQENIATGAAVTGLLAAVLVGASSANNPYYTAYNQQQDAAAVQDMMEFGAEMGSISYSKEQEREADLLGAYLLARAGYDLDRAKNTLVVLSKLPGGNDRSRASLTDTHPASAERLVAWEKAVEEVRSNHSKLPYLKEEDNVESD
ncbi:MAG: hypothetical protein DYH13_07600 [Alphaproteobacteria bacterium PRO2]|nr:hypothetical protein [Alphaproteobacteria bacterium PRO2]